MFSGFYRPFVKGRVLIFGKPTAHGNTDLGQLGLCKGTTSASQQVAQRNDFFARYFKNQGPREKQFPVKSTNWESNFTPGP